MKKAVTVKVQEVEGEGLLALLGKRVLLMCLNYFYEGDLVGVNDTCVLLEDAGIVYETGKWSEKSWADRQQLPGPHYVQISAIESFCESPSAVIK